jgi:hypothetical protein
VAPARLRFSPDEGGCDAWIATVGEVPVGEAAWQFHDGSAWGERALTVAELSSAEVAEAARAGSRKLKPVRVG